MPHRIAFTGASGTGKSSLAAPLARALGLPLQPSFSRLVAEEMGLASPYDVDALGRRVEFQTRVLDRLLAWQVAHHATGYVTDRTVWDVHCYTSLHASTPAVDASAYSILRALEGLGVDRFYTRVFLCPMDSFFHVGSDPARVVDARYHRNFEALLVNLLRAFQPDVDFSLIRCSPDARPLWLEQLQRDLASSPP